MKPEKKELEEFLRLAFAIVEQEHAQMPKVCSICGGKMEPSWQALWWVNPNPVTSWLINAGDAATLWKSSLNFLKSMHASLRTQGHKIDISNGSSIHIYSLSSQILL